MQQSLFNGRTSVSPSVCPVDRQQERLRRGLVRATDITAANAGSVMPRADGRGSTQTCLLLTIHYTSYGSNFILSGTASCSCYTINILQCKSVEVLAACMAHDDWDHPGFHTISQPRHNTLQWRSQECELGGGAPLPCPPLLLPLPSPSPPSFKGGPGV